jgi:hypothetical protein
MIAKIIVAVILCVLMILCMKGTLDSIRNNDNSFAVICSIASSLFGLFLGILLGSLIM